jgi:diaminopimelate decarboxylase
MGVRIVWRNSQAPGHRRDPAGGLSLGGVRADDLASTYGTPLIVMDVSMIHRAIDGFREICDPPRIAVSYAAKAFVCEALARLLSGRGIGMDVCSLGELRVAERAGYQAQRLTMHGAGKTDSELHAALDGRVGRIVLDGISDLARLAELAKNGPPVSVVLRLNTGLAVRTHEHVRTVGEDAKFGLLRDEEAAATAIVQAEPNLRFAGLHAHAGSAIADEATLVANVGELRKAATRFAARGLISTTLIAGGGFGVQTDPRRPEDALDVGMAIAAACPRESPAALAPTVEFEPGRAIVAHAGTTLYRVLAVKRRTDRNLVIVDGGMADNPRPTLYGAYHHIVPATAIAGARRIASVFGRACESDFIADTALPDAIERGDLLATCTTGAYTYSMSSHYNGFPKPPVVAVESGAHRVWIDRASE